MRLLYVMIKLYWSRFCESESEMIADGLVYILCDIKWTVRDIRHIRPRITNLGVIGLR